MIIVPAPPSQTGRGNPRDCLNVHSSSVSASLPLSIFFPSTLSFSPIKQSLLAFWRAAVRPAAELSCSLLPVTPELFIRRYGRGPSNQGLRSFPFVLSIKNPYFVEACGLAGSKAFLAIDCSSKPKAIVQSLHENFFQTHNPQPHPTVHPGPSNQASAAFPFFLWSKPPKGDSLAELLKSHSFRCR